MTPKEQAKQLVDKIDKAIKVQFSEYEVLSADYDSCCDVALICVQQIINANPHSNPFNN